MVLVHGLLHGHMPPRASTDLDLMVDIRVAPNALRELARYLSLEGFSTRGPSPDGVDLRYYNGPVIVDLLAPDGLSASADLTTTPPGRSIQTAGGTQALDRMIFVEAQYEGRRAEIPVPSLAGAIGIKASAVDHGYALRHSNKHLVDTAFLLCLAGTTGGLKILSPGDKKLIARCRRLHDPDSAPWAAQDDGLRPYGVRLMQQTLRG